MKKFLYIILSLFLVFAPAYAYATTSVGGWTATDSLIAGANTTINATKTAGGKVLNSAVTVGASAAKVGKHLIKGGGQAALAYAVVELLGEGIDWVLDPANNAVRYTKPDDAGVGAYFFTMSGITYRLATVDLACAKSISVMKENLLSQGKENAAGIGLDSIVKQSSTQYLCNWSAVKYGSGGNYVNYDPDFIVDDKPLYLPIGEVAAQVISNAESGHAPSQEAVKATALEGFAAGDHDAALDYAAVESDAGTDNPPDTTNPDNPAPTDPTAPFQLPAFCSWAAPVCTFIDWSKNQWLGFTLTFTALKDWLFEDAPPNDKDNTIDTPVLPVTPVQVAINFVGSCPAPLTFEYKIYNQTFRPAVPFTPMCEVAVMINPVIKICATIAAIYIVAGIRQGS